MTGNSLLDLMILAIPATFAGLWWTGSRARELAIMHAQQACQRRQLQFLDQTVAMSHIRPARSSTGSGCFRREYQFEFTSEGQHRDLASVTMLGHRLHNIYFPYTRDSAGNRIYNTH